MRKKSKFGLKLYELKRIRDILDLFLERSKIIFSKIINCTNEWRWVEKIKKLIIAPHPATVRDGTVLYCR